jgi:hypothetical protein
MGVDRVGLALPAAGLAVGLLALDDGQAGGSDRAGQPDPEAAGALDTTTRGPGAWSTIQASNSAKPELSLLIFRVPIAVPVGSASSTSWVSRWVAASSIGVHRRSVTELADR